jgi:polyisoprenoid-binding protein YceI
MNRTLIPIVAFAALFAHAGPAASAPEPRPFDVDAARSSLEIDVYKGGFLAAFGHDHLIAAKEFSGSILLDPERPEGSSVTFRVNTRALTVVDPDVSDLDRVKVQSTMQSDRVLDIARFPEIVFVSTGVTRTHKNGDSWTVTVTGKLSLHGVEKEATLPLILKLTGGEIEGQGEVTLNQTDYGITPVKVAGGMVKVKDTVRIRFVIRTRGTSP